MKAKREFLHLGIAVFIFVGTFPILRWGSTTNARSTSREQLLLSFTNGAVGSGCLSPSELAEAVNNLLIETASEQARVLLVNDGKKSSECRKQVVKELISLMSKHTDIGSNSTSALAWQRGREVMDILKPDEALDFLISNLTLYDRLGFGAAHLPATEPVIRIGSRSIPKLYSVLRNSSDRRTRLFAVYCLGLIGGRSGLHALRSALPTESDPSINNFIRLTIHAFHNTTLRNQITSRDRTKWLVAFYRDLRTHA
jgi:hypothetical protein